MSIYITENHSSFYCVYLTIYRGNKLPPFYIGSTSLSRLEKGYKGSVSSLEYKITWRQELENNPHLFESKIILICETRELAYEKEDTIQRSLNVVTNPLYVNKAYSSLRNRGAWNKGLTKENDIRVARYSGLNPKKSLPGNKNGMYDKTHSDEVKSALAIDAIKRFKGKSYEELYGKEKANELKKKRSEDSKGKDNAGIKNPMARKIIITDPSGMEIFCHGSLRETCVELGLTFHLIYNVLRNGTISTHPKINGYSARYLD